MEVIVLQSANTRVELLPQRGGAIGRYLTESGAQSYDWLRPAGVEHPSAFPMVPFCSRIRNARFCFAERTVQLAANLPPEPHAIHGHGWQNPWQVSAQADASAVLEYRHRADAWPWDYHARQKFALAGDRLTVSLSVRNAGLTPMPAGLGLHPFFLRTPGVQLQALVTERWEMDEQVMPLQRVPLGGSDLASGIDVAGTVLDTVFAGWDQRFRLHWPEWEAGLSVRAAQVFAHLVVYTPAGEDFFCVEPASNVTDAFNMLWHGDAGHGAVVLEPGETLAGAIEFTPRYAPAG